MNILSPKSIDVDLGQPSNQKVTQH
jgi:hypothetical protein